MVINKNTIFITLLFLSLLSNEKIIAHFRFVDFAVFFYSVIYFKDMSLTRNELFLISGFILVASLTSILNLDGNPRAHEFVFFYKYIFFFLILILIRNFTSTKEHLKLYSESKSKNPRLLLPRMLGLYYIAYNFYFFANNSLSVVSGASRVSIPFSSNEVGTSNAPAYSIVLFAVAIFLDRYGRSKLDTILMICLIISAVLAGSRSGIVIFLLYIIFHRRPLIDIKVTVLILGSAPLFVLYGAQLSGLFLDLISRTFEFNLINDVSANDRLFKQILALQTTLEHSLMSIGLGHENTTITWYDGMIGNLLIIGGAPALICYSLLVYSISRSVEPGPRMFIVLFTLVSLISEFVLTSYVCGVLLFLAYCSKETLNASKTI